MVNNIWSFINHYQPQVSPSVLLILFYDNSSCSNIVNGNGEDLCQTVIMHILFTRSEGEERQPVVFLKEF